MPLASPKNILHWTTKTVSVKRRLRTADCRLRPGVKCRLSVKCRLQTESKTQAGCRIKTVDIFKHLCSLFSKSVKQLAGTSYTLRFLVEVHCTFSILGQQLSFKRKHRGVAPIHGPWSRISKTSHLKLKREVSRTEKKVQDCDYVFGSSMTFQRRKEWICKSRCRQVSVRLHVLAAFFCP